MFPLDVTQDFKEELVTVWTAGMAFEVVIFSLRPEPKIIFQQGFRHHVSFVQEFEFPYRKLIRISTGGDNFGDVTTKTYGWSRDRARFEELETHILRRDREKQGRNPQTWGEW